MAHMKEKREYLHPPICFRPWCLRLITFLVIYRAQGKKVPFHGSTLDATSWFHNGATDRGPKWSELSVPRSCLLNTNQVSAALSASTMANTLQFIIVCATSEDLICLFIPKEMEKSNNRGNFESFFRLDDGLDVPRSGWCGRSNWLTSPAQISI